ncbi:MAG: Spy/CpxP family protein refolding chaperone [Magnetococcales bacterium]|nr:Spy/CpxP family protein refolding chaperone [Magnetococcales bacterium]
MNTMMTRKFLTRTVPLALMLGTFAAGTALAEEATSGQNAEPAITHPVTQGEHDMEAVHHKGHGGQGCHMMGDHHDGLGGPVHSEVLKHHLGVIKQKLAITPAQEAAWTAYAKVLVEQNDARAVLHNERHSMANKHLDPVEKQGRHIEVMERILTQKKAVFEAFKTLYAQLDNHQKEILTAKHKGWRHH